MEASNDNISICIPYVFADVREDKIRGIFEDLNIGEISRIDMKQKMDKNGKEYQLVFIHFAHWFDNEEAIDTKAALLEEKEIKVYYSTKWFWKITMARKQERPERRNDDDGVATRRKPRIVIG